MPEYARLRQCQPWWEAEVSLTGRLNSLSGIKQDREQYPPYAEVKRAIFASSVPYLFAPSAALNGMPEEKQGMYWQILDTPTLRFLSRAFGPPGRGAPVCGCPRLFLHVQDGIVGGSTTHPSITTHLSRAAKPYGIPSGTASGVVDQTHTNVRDGTQAVVIAHEELNCTVALPS